MGSCTNKVLARMSWWGTPASHDVLVLGTHLVAQLLLT